jgi:hypothetical protein
MINPQILARCAELLSARGFDIDTLDHDDNGHLRVMAWTALVLSTDLDGDQAHEVLGALIGEEY